MPALRAVALLLLVAASPVGARAQTGPAGLPVGVLREVQGAATLPPGRYSVVRTWSAAGPLAQHQYGRPVDDAEAEAGRAWEAAPNADQPAGAMLYGPYLPVASGDYVAFLRMKVLEDAGDEAVADIDATVSFAKDLLASRELRGTDLAVGGWVQVPLAFHAPAGNLECRVTWRGYYRLRLDTVSLYRVEGGRIPPPPRAAPAVPSGKPAGLTLRTERRPFADVFPRSATPSPDMVVIDAGRLSPDWQLLVASLQGLVNREKPRLYCLYGATDQQWLDWMRRRGWVRTTRSVQGAEELIARFRSAFRGLVITDPSLPVSKNVATMLAGLNQGLVASPRVAAQLRLPVLDDLRGRWKTSVEATRWAFERLWPRLNHHVLACLHPDQPALRDYLVANHVFIFWLSGPIDGARPYANPTAEARLMERLLARMPANIPVMGYPWNGKDIGMGEGPGVTLFAEFAKYLVGSVGSSNLTVHSGIRPAALRQRQAPPPPPLRRDKVYLSFVISDGDNLPVLTAGNFPQLWASPVRGRFPIGWTVSPSAQMLLPDVVDYYYRTSSPNDYWLAAVSGIGYTYPDSYAKRYRSADRVRAFDGFLAQTADYMARLGLREIWPMGVAREDLIARYAERIPGLRAIFPDYGRRVSGYEDATYPTARGVPVFHALTNWSDGMSRPEQVASVVAQVRAAAPDTRPAFLHVFVLNWFADLPMLEEVLRDLGSGYVAVRPDHLAAMYRAELARQRLLVRAPASLSAIAGRRSTFAVVLQNVTASPIAVSLKADGLGGGAVTPPRVRVGPGRHVPVTVGGTPTGRPIIVSAAGPFGTRSATVRVERLPAGEIVGSLPAASALRFVRRFEAAGMPHRSGRPVREGERTVWSAEPGAAEPGYIVYGPYAEIPRGHYLALFRVKRAGPGSGAILTVDSSSNGGRSTTASRTVTAEQLPLGQYRLVPLVLTHPGGPLEARVNWAGGAAVAVDSISLWQVVGR